MNKKIILIVTLVVVSAYTVFAKPLQPHIRSLIESQMPRIEQDIEHNTELLNNNKRTATQLEEYLNRLDKKADKELLVPGKKFLAASKDYIDWQSKYIAALQMEVEVYDNMLNTNEYDSRWATINLGRISERQHKLEHNLIEAQTKYNIAVKAYNLKISQ